MTRQQKFPDTKTFHFHNANPKGRLTTDCVFRAISTATGIPYADVVRQLAEWQIKTGYDSGDDKCYGRYLESIGWVKMKQPRKRDGRKYTGKEWCELLNEELDFRGMIAHIGGHHVVAISGCQVWDTWNSTDGCIGNYWIKGK